MTAARYFRAVCFDTRGADLELSACHLHSAGDPHYPNVVLQLQFEGEPSGSITDSGVFGMAVAKYGAVQNSTERAKHGASSGVFPGAATDYLVVPNNSAFAFGTGDFTIEAWIYIPTGISGGYAAICDTRQGPAGNGAVLFKLTSSRQIGYYGASEINSSAQVPLREWAHVALCRASGVSRLFINGVIVGTVNDTDNKAAGPVYIGRVYDAAHPALSAFVDDLRITKGVARYPTGFTPPSAFSRGAVRVDAGAEMSSSMPPASGAVATLQSEEPVAVTRWDAHLVRTAGFWLQWDLGAGNVADPTTMSLGGAAAAAWPDRALLLSSDDARTWTAVADLGRFAYPGMFEMTNPEAVFLPHRTQMAGAVPEMFAGGSPPAAAVLVPHGKAGLDVEDGGRGRIYGTVESKGATSNQPLHRRVRLVHQRSGRFVRETWSAATTGAFSFDEIKMGEIYYAIAFDHDGNFRGVVADSLLPEAMP